MKNVTAKTGIPLTYTINAVDGQPAGVYWEFYWEILNNATGTSDQKGQILNNNINSNKVFITWLRKTEPGETFIIKCHIKVKSSLNVVTCEKDEYINVVTDDEGSALSENIIITPVVETGYNCKKYNAINKYKACCEGAKKIKWIVNGGHIAIIRGDSIGVIGSAGIKDTISNCSEIAVIWDVKDAGEYSITAYGIDGSKTSKSSKVIEKIINTDVIVPVITFDDSITLGETDTASISYTISNFYWNSFPTNYTINAWVKVGTYLKNKPGATGVSDDDYTWSTVENIAGGTIGYYTGLNTNFTKEISIPTTYSTTANTKFRFKLINIEVVAPTDITDCYVSSNGKGPYGPTWVLEKDYNNDLELIFEATENEFPIAPLKYFNVPDCYTDFEFGDTDAVASPCTNNIILGVIRPCRKGIPKFGDIKATIPTAEFGDICYSFCILPVIEFGNICITTCEDLVPLFGQVATTHAIKATSCFDVVPEFSTSPDICYSVCVDDRPAFGEIGIYNRITPIFNNTPGKYLCVTECSFDGIEPVFDNTPGYEPCYSTQLNLTSSDISFGDIKGMNIVPELSTDISAESQVKQTPEFNVSPDICNCVNTNAGIEFGEIKAYGISNIRFNSNICVCVKIEDDILFGSNPPDLICYSSQIKETPGFVNRPEATATPYVILNPYITAQSQIKETPQFDVDFPNNLTAVSCILETPTFTDSIIPGSRLCYERVTSYA